MLNIHELLSNQIVTTIVMPFIINVSCYYICKWFDRHNYH